MAVGILDYILHRNSTFLLCVPIMAFEQPLKKRRRYEMFMTEENSTAAETTGMKPSPISPAIELEITQHGKQQQERRVPGSVQQGPKWDFAPDEKLKKKRNREEIGTLYTAYCRLKFCLARQDETNFDLRQELEVSYNALLELSSGKETIFFCIWVCS